MAHTHRELRQGQGASLAEVLGQFPQSGKGRSGILRVVHGGRNAHETAYIQPGQLGESAPLLFQFCGGEAVLAGFAINIHLQQNAGGYS